VALVNRKIENKDNRNTIYLEKVIIEIQRADADIQGKLSLRTAAGRTEHTNHHTTFGNALHKVELTHTPGKQVSAHLGGHLEGHLLQLLATVGAVVGGGGRHVHRGSFRHVGDGHQMRRHDQGHREGCLDSRLVPAGEGTVLKIFKMKVVSHKFANGICIVTEKEHNASPSGIKSFELGTGHDLLISVGISIARLIKATHVAVEDATESDEDLALAFGESAVKHELHSVVLGVVVNLHHSRYRSSADRLKRNSFNEDLLGMEGDFGYAGLGDININHLIAVEL